MSAGAGRQGGKNNNNNNNINININNEVSAPGRNWYRTEDLVMGGLQIRPSKEARMTRIMESDIR